MLANARSEVSAASPPLIGPNQLDTDSCAALLEPQPDQPAMFWARRSDVETPKSGMSEELTQQHAAAAPDAAPQNTEPANPEPLGRLADLLDGPEDWQSCAKRVVLGLALSSTYGLALGMRHGGKVMLSSALGVAAAPLAILFLAVPALHIVLAVMNVPLDAKGLLRAAARGTAATGLALAGLAPAAALFVVTTNSTLLAMLIGGVGLIVAGVFGLRHLRQPYSKAMLDSEPGQWLAGNMAFIGFAIFSTILAARVWAQTLMQMKGA